MVFIAFIIVRYVFRVNSSIIAKTAKNKRKAEKKRRAVERRMSESDCVELKPPAVNHSGSLDLTAIYRYTYRLKGGSGDNIRYSVPGHPALTSSFTK